MKEGQHKVYICSIRYNNVTLTVLIRVGRFLPKVVYTAV